MTDNIVLSWLDLRNSTQRSDLNNFFEKQFSVKQFNRSQLSVDSLNQCKAHILCFEYDYPDIPSLNLLQEARKMYPDSPIVMFTEQHSEALAVWAFRTGVWDYFVLPLNDIGVSEIMNSLSNARNFCSSLRQQFRGVVNIRMPDEVRFRAPSGSKKILQPAINYIQTHYVEKISEDYLAELCAMKVSQFSRQFRATFDITFQEYLVQFRLNESARLLLNPIASISDVAYSVGFNDASYFARAFKKHYGITPSRFRQLLNEGESGNQQIEKLLKIA